MYNNDITYHKDHDTAENRAALKKLIKKYFAKSECGPSCPTSWAPEVLELMETIDRELGFRHNESSMGGYRIQGGPFRWFIRNPLFGLFHALKRNVSISDQSPYDRIKSVLKSFWYPICYGINAILIKKVNPIRNRLERRRVSLGQLKEKYGELNVYFSGPEAFDEWIEHEIRKCEMKLAAKGVYYPVENYWDAGVRYTVNTEYSPDTISTKVDEKDGSVDVIKTQYRKAMLDLDMDLTLIKEKAEIAAATKQSIKDAKSARGLS